MNRRWISLLLVAALLMALPVTASAASKYSDLDGHWSEPYITKLSDLGYITGYDDGTVKPENMITACEALALLSRFYQVDEDVAQLIHEDYGEFISENIDPALNWAYDEFEICLAAGIISEKELRSLRLTNTIDKELLSVLLVRALQLVEEANAATLAGAQLTFDDVDEINRSYRGYVAVLVDSGIIVGDSHNCFSPKLAVSRAVVSTMVVRGLEYVSKNNRTPVLAGYEDAVTHMGVITEVGTGYLILRDTRGICRDFTIPSNASVTMGGLTAVLNSDLEDHCATVRMVNGAVTAVTVKDDYSGDWSQGRLTEVAKTASGYNLTIEDLETGRTRKGLITSSAKVTVDGAEAEVTALKTGMFLTLCIRNKAVTQAIAATSTFTLSGTVSLLTYGVPVKLEITDEDGTTVRFDMDLNNLPEITRGDNTSSIERISVGDKVTVSIKSCQVSKIATAASDDTVDGTIQSIVSTVSGTSWVLRDTRGLDRTLLVDPLANAYQGSTAILVNTIQVGDSVSVVTDGKTITEIYLKSSNGNTSTKLNGTVLTADATARQITVINSSGKLIYISAKSSAAIVKASTGGKIGISNIEPNSQLVAYGTYTDASNFNATSIILEN